jgi:hypothetical protein
MFKFVDGGNTKHRVTNDKQRLLMFAVHWCLMFLCKGNIQMISLEGDSFFRKVIRRRFVSVTGSRKYRYVAAITK